MKLSRITRYANNDVENGDSDAPADARPPDGLERERDHSRSRAYAGSRRGHCELGVRRPTGFCVAAAFVELDECSWKVISARSRQRCAPIAAAAVAFRQLSWADRWSAELPALVR